MFFDLVFESSGDTIPYKSCNDQFVIFYIDWLNKNDYNKFKCVNNPVHNLNQALDSLHESLLCYNYLNLETLSQYEIPTLELGKYLDQQILNDYHARWVNAQTAIVDIISLRKKVNKSIIEEKLCNIYSDDILTQEFVSVIHRLGLKKVYNNINDQIHNIEDLIGTNKEYNNGNLHFIQNNYSKDILSHSQANLQITGHHKGRSLYDKFKLFDENFEADDENTFDQISNSITFNLCKLEDTIPSTQFVDWCTRNNRKPIGEYLNLGNIVNLDKHLTKYRQIMYNNLNKNQSFTLVKGT
jgi:predicted nucleic acid-binding protein